MTDLKARSLAKIGYDLLACSETDGGRAIAVQLCAELRRRDKEVDALVKAASKACLVIVPRNKSENDAQKAVRAALAAFPTPASEGK